MVNIKPATLTLRIDPAIKEGLRLISEQQHRSMTNMIEVMIREYCREYNITIPEQQTLFNDKEDS